MEVSELMEEEDDEDNSIYDTEWSPYDDGIDNENYGADEDDENLD